MRYNPFGTTGFDISVLTLGTMTWGRQNTEAEGHAQMDYAVENGINSFIEDYCKKWQFDRNQTSFYISVDNKQLFIKAYLNDKNIDQIAIKSIIKFLF